MYNLHLMGGICSVIVAIAVGVIFDLYEMNFTIPDRPADKLTYK